jgi:3',5'-cyclic AMP phosphodiesterase CpdA
VNILVLSDLHIGDSARCSSMTPKAAITSKSINEGLVDKLILRLKEDFPKIDYVVLPGDMADRAQHEQYEHLDLVIERITTDLKILPTQVVFSPGNHDVDWATLSATGADHSSERRWASRYTPIKESRVIKSSLENGVGNPFSPEYVVSWAFPGIEFIALNTAAKDKPNDDNHPGEISREMLDAVVKAVAKSAKAEDSPRVLLIHHHPIQYENMFIGWKDFSILQCPADLINFCGVQRIDMIIHGHRHQPNFKQMMSQDGRVVGVFASGSFSARFPAYVYDDLSNQAHVVSLSGRDEETSALKGALNSLAFSQVNGWRPSRRATDGIDARVPFGSLLPAHSLYLMIREFVAERLADVGHVKMTDIITYQERLGMQPPQVLEAVIKKIEAEFHTEQFGVDPTSAILVKEAKGG